MTSGVKLLLEKHQENNRLNIVLQMILLETNKEQAEEFLEYFESYKQKGLKVFIKGATNFANQISDKTIVNETHSKNSKAICYEPWRGFTVAWDGNVYPCCMDYDGKINLGDLNHKNIKWVWNNRKMIDFRQKHINGNIDDISPCNRCDVPCENESETNSMLSSFNPVQKEMLFFYRKGLYPYESHSGGFFWTEKEFELLILDKFRTIKLEFLNSNPSEKIIELKVFLYGESIGTYQLEGTTWIELPVIEKFKGRLLRYEFLVSDTWIPSKLSKSEDSRQLGVVLKNIKN